MVYDLGISGASHCKFRLSFAIISIVTIYHSLDIDEIITISIVGIVVQTVVLGQPSM